MEIVLFATAFLLMGLRHGLDSDHVAAIADMVGTESTKGSGRTFRLGVMYALGHGIIVFIIGMIAVCRIAFIRISVERVGNAGRCHVVDLGAVMS